MSNLRWFFSPQWCAWWLVVPSADKVTQQLGYGPFVTEWECKMAGDVHGVPFTGKESP